MMQTEVVDAGGRAPHPHLPVLVPEQSVDDGRLARRDITQHGDPDLELRSHGSSHRSFISEETCCEERLAGRLAREAVLSLICFGLFACSS